jgi:hypothetical protein
MKSLFLFAIATTAVLASAAFATPGPRGGTAHQAGDRLSILTDDQACKIPNVRAGHAGKASGGPDAGGPDWERTAIYLDHVDRISCLGRAPVKD